MVSELLKGARHRGEEPDLWFWRDSAGHEMDVLLDRGTEQVPVEIKSGETVAGDFFDALRWWRRLVGNDEAPGALVHGGQRSFVREGFTAYAWADV